MDKKSFGIKLRKVRTSKNMTILELSEKSGVSKSAISKYELGDSSPSIDAMYELAKSLNVTISYLTGEYIKNNDMVGVIQSILDKLDIESTFIDTSNMTEEELMRLEDDFRLAINVVLERRKNKK